MFIKNSNIWAKSPTSGWRRFPSCWCARHNQCSNNLIWSIFWPKWASGWRHALSCWYARHNQDLNILIWSIFWAKLPRCWIMLICQTQGQTFRFEAVTFGQNYQQVDGVIPSCWYARHNQSSSILIWSIFWPKWASGWTCSIIVDMPDTRSDSDMAETGNMNGCYSLLVIVLNIL